MSFNTRAAVGLIQKRGVVGSGSVTSDLALRTSRFRWGSKLGQEIESGSRGMSLLTPSILPLEEGLVV